jgi:hypothetical protein
MVVGPHPEPLVEPAGFEERLAPHGGGAGHEARQAGSRHPVRPGEGGSPP